MTDWAARAAYIEEQVGRALQAFTPGTRKTEHEWIARWHAANRWEELPTLRRPT